MSGKTQAPYAEFTSDAVKLPMPTLHHPVDDRMITQLNPFAITTGDGAHEYMNAFAQAMAHTGLYYVQGLTPEIVTSKVSASGSDIRDGVWFPAYRAAGTPAAKTHPGYLFARDVMHMNKSLQWDGSKLEIDRAASDGAWEAMVTKTDSTFTALPVSAAKNASDVANHTSDTVVTIKDSAGTIFYCPLVQSSGAWNGPIIRPKAFGGQCQGAPYSIYITPTLESHTLETDVLEVDMLGLKDGAIKDTTFSPIGLNSTLTSSTALSSASEFAAALHASIQPILPLKSANDLADRGEWKVYGRVKAGFANAKELRVSNILVTSDTTGSPFFNKNAKFIASAAPKGSVNLSDFVEVKYFPGTITTHTLATGTSGAVSTIGPAPES